VPDNLQRGDVVGQALGLRETPDTQHHGRDQVHHVRPVLGDAPERGRAVEPPEQHDMAAA
jgi:hypothetical protein